ncbi:MAG: PASTA domain-containing protein [Clostridia bacterium]|nr:PASTA domain-containing protein [Clostridia bacterium]
MKPITKKTTHRRIVAVFILFAFFGIFLLGNILRLSYFLYDYYREKTYDQVTTSSTLYAERGSIYDSNMNILAASRTVWRVFVSTRDIKLWKKESGIEYDRIIASGLGTILSLDAEALYNKIKNSNVLDVTVKKSVGETEYKKVLEFIEKNSLERLIFTEASTSRYYPENTLAAHVLGFTGSDNQGLYGLEYHYDEVLSGKDGYYVYAKDANGNALDTEYSAYFPAEDGQSLVTTIDSYIQRELEAIIEQARVNSGAENRVTGIVMDTKTGAILGMATTSPFNPNTPFVLDELSQAKLNSSGLAQGSAEYNAYKTELMQIMWSNKAVSETYEPGSTFKILTVSAALDMGVVDLNDTFSCQGYCAVGGWKIKCHKAGGHGSGFNLAYGLQMSCNPCMIAISERMGSDSFYSYVNAFGLLEKTGIDLPSEAISIFHKQEAIGPTELATASFGQRFKVSVINQLTAIASVANGGNLITPYVVDKILDSDGNTVFQHETKTRRNVVSTEVANTVSKILVEGVNGSGGAKNAGVSGYDIAAKTGTSQKFDVLDENGNSYLRIGSTVAYSTDSDKGVAMIIVVDEPTSQVKYGSVIAAPYVSKLMEKVLPYLEYRKNSPEVSFTVESYVGLTVESAKKRLKESKISYEVVGEGDFVLAQTPNVGEVFTYPVSKIILYTTEDVPSEVCVPNLCSLTLAEAIQTAIDAGFNIKISGMSELVPSATDVVCEQSLPPGSMAPRGTVITIRAINTNYED